MADTFGRKENIVLFKLLQAISKKVSSELTENIRKKENPMYDAMTQLNKDHAVRQIQRIKTRAPIALVTVLIVVEIGRASCRERVYVLV